MKKKKIALILNIIIVLLELLGFGYTLSTEHHIALEYYTNDSNLITLIGSLLFIIFYKRKKEFVKDIRFLSTILLTVTFLVVIFILCPMYNFNYKLLMFTNTFFIYHTLCPIICFISYIFFEEGSKKKYLGLAFTILYSIILISLNFMNIVDGPYPFLQVTKQSPIMVITWGTIIIGGSYLIGLLIYKLNKQNGKKGANIG